MKEWTAEKEQQEKENRPINIINQSGNATTYQIGGQLSGPRATAMPVYTEAQSCPPGCHCSIHVHASGSIGPNRHERQSYRQHPYGREQKDSLYCHFCANIGHTQNRCWLKFPHLHSQWKIDMDRARGITPGQGEQRNIPHVVQVPDSQLRTRQSIATLAAAYQPIQNPAFPMRENEDRRTQQTQIMSANFSGLSSSTGIFNQYSRASITQKNWSNTTGLLGGKSYLGQEYCFPTQGGITSPIERQDGGVRLGYEPAKWLVDSGASNYFSSFKFLFLNLIPLHPPINVLTGNRWITA